MWSKCPLDMEGSLIRLCQERHVFCILVRAERGHASDPSGMHNGPLQLNS